MKKKIGFNIHDLNFILTFAGFAIFTSITESIPSVAYRAVALAVALICLTVRREKGFKLGKLPTALRVLLVLMLILDFKAAFHLLTEDTPFTDSRNLALLFIFGVTLIPVLAFVAGYKKIHWKQVLVFLELLLFFTIIQGYMTTLEVTDDMRMSLNSRQSTLAFGDNSSYLFLLSICLLKYSASMFAESTKRWFWRLFLLIAIVISVLGMARAGSRGPVIAALMGGLFILVTLSFHKQLNAFFLIAVFVSVFGITTSTLEKFAPVLFARMSATIEEGDTSGRDVLFAHAIQKIEDNPIIGGNPIVVLSDGFTGYHNGYLAVGVGLGLAGFIAYIILSLWILSRLLVYRHRLTSPALLFIGSMFFLSATRAMTGAGLVDNPNYALSVVCACIVASRINKTNHEFFKV